MLSVLVYSMNLYKECRQLKKWKIYLLNLITNETRSHDECTLRANHVSKTYQSRLLYELQYKKILTLIQLQTFTDTFTAIGIKKKNQQTTVMCLSAFLQQNIFFKKDNSTKE